MIPLAHESLVKPCLSSPSSFNSKVYLITAYRVVLNLWDYGISNSATPGDTEVRIGKKGRRNDSSACLSYQGTQLLVGEAVEPVVPPFNLQLVCEFGIF